MYLKHAHSITFNEYLLKLKFNEYVKTQIQWVC